MRLEEIGAATAVERAKALLRNLGFTEPLMERAMRNLSGGWRVRTALTAALFAQPDVLLLDEPTNHLSIDAVMWLSRELDQGDIWASRIVVVVSHDRCFIEDACTDMMHISGVARRLTQTPGRYSVWAKRREEQQAAWKRKAEIRNAKREKLDSYANHGFKYGGSSGQISMQQKMLKQVAKSDEQAAIEDSALADLNEDEELPLLILAGGMLPKAAAVLNNVAFGYPGQDVLFRGAEFTVDSHSRICLLGENGNGKTTLLKLVMDALTPTEGTVSRAPGCRIEIVTQHHADQLDFDMTPLKFMLKRFPGTRSYDHEQTIRGHLAECGIDVGLQNTPARALSGGQRSRVALAATSFARPHVLVLDEPTNNLDLEAVQALADAVESFEGGVVVVSHDQYFVGRVAKEVWVVENGAVKRAESFLAYKKQVLRGLRAAR
ncbi:hypothetical protein FOA52_010600 [Chlamydomonas sp. UWO 241]|nr:hypothetical protein FOA52_010600 [Chlamydomonas sp. UWO 241]